MRNCRHVVCGSRCVHRVAELHLLPRAMPPNIANQRVGDGSSFGLGTTSTRCGARLPDSRRLPPRFLLRPGRQLGGLKHCKAEHPGRAQRVGARAERSMTQFNAPLSTGPWVEPTRACPPQTYSHKFSETQPARKRIKIILKSTGTKCWEKEPPPGGLLR